MSRGDIGITRVDAAHQPPSAATSHAQAALQSDSQSDSQSESQSESPAPFCWQDLNLSSEKVDVEVQLGTRRISQREVESFQAGRVVRPDRSLQEPVEIRMKDGVIGLGRLVVVEGRLGIEIIELRQVPCRQTA